MPLSYWRPRPWHDDAMSRHDRDSRLDGGPLSGPLRIEPSVRALVRRLRPGDIAVVDILDLDQPSAQALAAAKPAAVVDVQAAISGRFPTGGPRVLLDAGITLVDQVGSSILSAADGAVATVTEGTIAIDGVPVASGRLVTDEVLREALVGAADGMRIQLANFTANALDQADREADTILKGAGLPDIDLDMRGRHVVVIAPGVQYRTELASLKRYLRDHRPVIVAIGEAADAALKLASAPDLIIGDLDGVGDDVLRSADRVLLHEPSGGNAGQARVDALGIAHAVADSALSSTALAILLAHTGDAEVIVTVGVEASLSDYLESVQTEVAGTFLARLQAGSRLVDAPALAHVYRHRYSGWTLMLMVISGLVALGVAIAVTPGGRAWVSDLWDALVSLIGGA